MAANRADAAAAGLVLRPVVFPPAAQVAAESPAPAGDDAPSFQSAGDGAESGGAFRLHPSQHSLPADQR